MVSGKVKPFPWAAGGCAFWSRKCPTV